MPTRPKLSYLTRSTPPVETANSLAAGEKIPVSTSLPAQIAGAAAVPEATLVTLLPPIFKLPVIEFWPVLLRHWSIPVAKSLSWASCKPGSMPNPSAASSCHSVEPLALVKFPAFQAINAPYASTSLFFNTL